MEEKKKKALIESVICIVLLLVAEGIFWRDIMFTDSMLGDLGDGRFTALSADHWWRFITGKEAFSQIPIFYPNTTAIGYSDLHMAFGLIMIPFRLFGGDLYFAFKASVIAIHLLGLVSMYYLLNRVLKISPLISAVGTVAFSHCCGLSAVSGHPQLFAVGMMPLLLIFFIRFIEHFKERKKRNIYAYLTLFWFILLVYTSWYMACFTGLFSLIFIIIYIFRMSGKHWSLFKWLKDVFKEMGYDVIGYVVFTVILAIPFIRIYVPAMRESSMYEYSGFYLPDPIDLINVSENNLMIGWFLKLINISARGRDHELVEGISLVLLIMFVISLVMLLKKCSGKEKLARMIPATAALTTLVCIVLMIRWDGANLSLWAIVYALILPMRAVHAVARFLLWLCFPMSIVAAYQADRMKVFEDKKTGKLLAAGLFVLMAFSTFNKVGLSNGFLHQDRVDFMNGIAQSPDEMQSFYLVDSSHSDYPWFASQLDAWEIATVVNKPTLNGYSGHFPAGWGLSDLNADYYEPYAEMWISDHGLTGVYVYDKADNTWRAH